MSDAPIRTATTTGTGSAPVRRYIRRDGVDIEVDENYQPINVNSARASPHPSPSFGPRKTVPVVSSTTVQQQQGVRLQPPFQTTSERQINSGQQHWGQGQPASNASMFSTLNKPSDTQVRSNYTAQFSKPTMGTSYNQSSRMSASSNQGLPEVVNFD